MADLNKRIESVPAPQEKLEGVLTNPELTPKPEKDFVPTAQSKAADQLAIQEAARKIAEAAKGDTFDNQVVHNAFKELWGKDIPKNAKDALDNLDILKESDQGKTAKDLLNVLLDASSPEKSQ